MKLIIVILSFSMTALAQRAGLEMWCNNGTAGDGGCEANGGATFCCAQDKEPGKFDINRKTLGTSRDPDGNPWCGEKGLQVVRCAPLN
ncbi:hypothetical protein HYALB_00008674 [Hymenoscyphus albidus]|uniref:Hydrophobin n=1 Tax=Hymenoscyphus albidus TaxID=595503 RepID=A0A9N9LG61_9HELO|nr:hypothetical protein HYALB_00008674 [Hymenoscyphus albidus]